MAERGPATLEQALHAARREYSTAQYPGDLASDLGLSDDIRPGWLQRWRPALALCAVLALAAGGVGLWALINHAPDVQPTPTAETYPTPIAPGPAVAHQPDTAADTPAPSNAPRLTREQFALVKQQVADLRADAKHDARARLAHLYADQEHVKLSVSIRPLTANAAGLTTLPAVNLSLPRGLSLPAYSPSFTKELS